MIFNFTFSLFETCILGLGVILWLLLILHLFRMHRIIATKPPTFNTIPLSVIICARNADTHLTEFLPKVLNQQYPKFEVIVVNDCSYDTTEHVLDAYQKIFPHLRYTTIKEDEYYKHGKKFAVLVGIKAAQYEHLVFTDADCYPHTDTWLDEVAASFGQEHAIVMGYGAYEKQKGLLNALIRWDTFYNAVFFLSNAHRGKAISGVGRNMGYLKSLFYKEKGFSKHYHIVSGDDDLFINHAAPKCKSAIYTNSNSITYSIAKTTFWSWTLQKARHLTTAPYYTKSSKIKLGYHFVLLYGFYGFIAAACTFYVLLPWALTIWFVKSVAHFFIMRRASKQLLEQDLNYKFLYTEPLWLLLLPWFKIQSLRFKPEFWMR
ncbi:MAG: glycosyltransferase [Bacteroidota bacterium]